MKIDFKKMIGNEDEIKTIEMSEDRVIFNDMAENFYMKSGFSAILLTEL